MQNFKASFASFLSRHPLVSLFAVILIAATACAGLPKLHASYSFKVWFSSNDPALVGLEKFEQEFGNDDSIVIAVHSPSGVFDNATVSLLRELTDDLWRVKDVMRVDSATNQPLVRSVGDNIEIEPLLPTLESLEKASQKTFIAQQDREGRHPSSVTVVESNYLDRKDLAMADPHMPDYLISRDAQTAVIYAHLKPSFESDVLYSDTVNEVRALLKKYEGNGDHSFHLTGSAVVAYAFQEVSTADLIYLTPIVFFLATILLYWTFRSWSAIALTLSFLCLTILMTFGIAGWLGLKFNVMTAALPNILIATTLADAIHLLSAFFLARGKGLSKQEALKSSLESNMVPTLLTSVTTVLGFLAFCTSQLAAVRELGLLAAIGIMVAWVVTVGLMPAALTYLPADATVRDESAGPKWRARITKYLLWIQRHRAPIIASWTIAFIVSLGLASRNEVNSDVLNYFADSVPVKQADQFLRDHVGGSRGVEIVIDSGKADGVKDPAFLTKADSLQDWIRQYNGVTKVTSIVDIVKDLNQALEGDQHDQFKIPATEEQVAQQLFLYSMSLQAGQDLSYWATMDSRKMRVKVLWTIENSKETLSFLKQMESKSKELGLNAAVSGKSALLPAINDHIVETFNSSNWQALALVAITMLLIFRSWKIGFLAMIPNVIPPAFGAAVMALASINYDVGTVLVMSVVMGIAVDDTIHFLTHYTEKTRHHGLAPIDAITEVFEETGLSLVLTTVILVVGFGVFALGKFTPSVNFGTMTAIALGLAIGADLCLLPAILMKKETVKSGVKT